MQKSKGICLTVLCSITMIGGRLFAQNECFEHSNHLPFKNLNREIRRHQAGLCLLPLSSDRFPLPSSTRFLVNILNSFSQVHSHSDEMWIAHRLILTHGISKENKEFAYKTILEKVKSLKNTTFQSISFELPPIIEGQADLYKPMNTSILKTDEGYLVLCRTVNYHLSSAGDYNCYDSKFRQRNFILHYDRDFLLLSQHEMIEELPRKHDYWINVEGIEDCRLISHNNAIWFVGTTLDTNPYHERQISLGRLGDKTGDGKIWVDKLTPLLGPDPRRCEKNWMPVVINGQMQMIYSYDPLIVYQPDLDTGECRLIEKPQSKHDFSRLRGSAPPIPFDEGYLMIVHETIMADSDSPEPNKRYYMHRFAYLDKECCIKKLSTPFTFKHLGVEFCAGITIDHSGKNLVMGVSIEDRESHFCLTDLETVRSMLKSLP